MAQKAWASRAHGFTTRAWSSSIQETEIASPPPSSRWSSAGWRTGTGSRSVAKIRTAPTEVIARAILRVVDEQLSKEKA